MNWAQMIWQAAGYYLDKLTRVPPEKNSADDQLGLCRNEIFLTNMLPAWKYHFEKKDQGDLFSLRP